MSAIHTRRKEDKFHENRREAQKVRTFSGVRFAMPAPVEEVLCEWCDQPVSSGTKVNGVLYHNDCFVKSCRPNSNANCKKFQ
jgi:hypothetical protein